jgi:hypothetical protein
LPDDARVPPIRVSINSGERSARVVRQWSQLDAAICFDEWIGNADRHKGNLLFDGANRFIMIDHSHAFFGNNWSVSDLQPDRHVDKNQLLQGWGAVGLSAEERLRLAQASVELARQFAAIDLDEVFRAARAETLMERDRREALMDFLRERCNHLPAIVKQKAGVPDLLP